MNSPPLFSLKEATTAVEAAWRERYGTPFPEDSAEAIRNVYEGFSGDTDLYQQICQSAQMGMTGCIALGDAEAEEVWRVITVIDEVLDDLRTRALGRIN